MFNRISKVKSLSTKTLSFASNLQIGDCSYIDGTALALAVQKKSDSFSEPEPDFSDYEIFTRPFYIPRLTEPIVSHFSNPNPFIRVGNIDIIGVSSSAIVGVGNIGHIRMESRIKHIRQIPKKNEDGTNDNTSDETETV